MVNRIKKILTAPKTEWAVIEGENAPNVKLFAVYLFPLSLIPAIAAFIGYGLIGYNVFGVHVYSVEWGIRQAAVQWIATVGGVYLTAFVISFLAEHFGAVKDFDRAFSLVAYAYTPVCLGGIFNILPSLAWLTALAGIYGLYLLYTGLQPVMKAPAEKNTGYFVASLLTVIVVSIAISAIMGQILLKSMFQGSITF